MTLLKKRTRLMNLIAACASLLFMLQAGAGAGQGSIDSNRIEDLIRESGAESVAVAFYDLANGEQFLIKPDESFHAASTMKVPVMMEVFRQAREGLLSLDDYIAIKNDFISIADNTRYSISPESDSEQSLYRRIGRTETVRELVRLMIDMSSNLATNLLIERVTAPRVMALMTELGAKNMRVLRGVEDERAYRQGLNNTTTARDLMIILRSIAERRAVSSKASDEMIKIMLDQKFNNGIPAGLPQSVRVAHKTGSITAINHDAAIIYPPRRKPYVLVVLTRGIQDNERSHKLIADISRAVFEAVVDSRKSD
ncbi:MAG TPA: serine hydrolase [Blastocatellia bacterium]|nr:serine hydrolase [Blastocatellia bacterium]